MISSLECNVCSSVFRFRPLRLTVPLAGRAYESAVSHCREGGSIRRRNAAHYADLVEFVPWGHAGSHLSGSATVKLCKVAIEDDRCGRSASAFLTVRLARSTQPCI